MDTIEFWILLPDGSHAQLSECKLVAVNPETLSESTEASLRSYSGGEQVPGIRTVTSFGSGNGS